MNQFVILRMAYSYRPFHPAVRRYEIDELSDLRMTSGEAVDATDYASAESTTKPLIIASINTIG